jgi:hypothetical protein
MKNLHINQFEIRLAYSPIQRRTHNIQCGRRRVREGAIGAKRAQGDADEATWKTTAILPAFSTY